MRARDVVGKRIVEIRQMKFWDERTRSQRVHFAAMVLDDGTWIDFTANESEHDPYVEAKVEKPRKRSPRKRKGKG